MEIVPTADGGFTGSARQTMSMPEAGATNIIMEVDFATATYDPAASAALNVIALETVSNDDMNALVNRVSSNGQTLLIRLIQVLPAEILQMIMNQ